MAAITLTGRFAAAFDLSVLLPGLYLAGALLVGAAVLALVRRWRQSEEPVREDAGDQLAHFRSLYEEGQLSEEEYRRLRHVLGGELRKSFDLPAAPDRTDAKVAFRPDAGAPTTEPPPEGIRPA